MTFSTVGRNMCSGEREVRLAVVETVFSFTGRVAVKASLADVNIPSYVIMFLIHVLLVVLMAGYATEFRIIVGV